MEATSAADEIRERIKAAMDLLDISPEQMSVRLRARFGHFHGSSHVSISRYLDGTPDTKGLAQKALVELGITPLRGLSTCLSLLPSYRNWTQEIRSRSAALPSSEGGGYWNPGHSKFEILMQHAESLGISSTEEQLVNYRTVHGYLRLNMYRSEYGHEPNCRAFTSDVFRTLIESLRKNQPNPLRKAKTYQEDLIAFRKSVVSLVIHQVEGQGIAEADAVVLIEKLLADLEPVNVRQSGNAPINNGTPLVQFG